MNPEYIPMIYHIQIGARSQPSPRLDLGSLELRLKKGTECDPGSPDYDPCQCLEADGAVCGVEGGVFLWVAVKELSLSYHSRDV